jgi:reversibly glycosylated polypeptide/UDP-arabinopyranose mutase
MRVLIVPTIREKSIKTFLSEWRKVEFFDATIIVEDNPEKTFEIDVDHHYCWKDIDKDLGNSAWIISRRDSAIRSYGFLRAYRLGAEYIFTLDDDCLPLPGVQFCETHLNNLNKTPKWTESVPGFRTRGLPYINRGILENVKMSVGLWEGIPDFDAIHMLSGHIEKIVLPRTRVMAKGQYFPLCGMNFAFRREATPLCLFPLMGQGQPFGRFDDIWFGVISKKVFDHLDWHITVGEPYIHHSKASDPFNNLVREAPGIKFNEKFWEVIDGVQLSGNSPTFCMEQIGRELSEKEDAYLKKLGEAILLWSSLFPNP